MLTEALQQRVADATVRFTKAEGGQGVLVSGGVVLTAAHCLDWEWVLDRQNRNHYSEQVQARKW